MIMNPDNNSTVWYHSTPRDRIESILKDGLKIFSPSSNRSGSSRVPWTYVSSKPLSGDLPVFTVDLSDIKDDAAKEFFGGRVDGCIYQRVFVDIPPDRLSLMSETLFR